MEINILEQNLKQIKRYNQILAEKINKHDYLNKPFEFAYASTGDVIIHYDNHFLHSEIDPQQEALDVYSKIPSDSPDTIHILFGIGLGYLFKRFAMSVKGKIIVYETNIDLLRIALEVVDFSEELSKKNIMITNNELELEKAFEVLFFDNSDITLSFLPSYRIAYPEMTNKVVNKLGFLKGMYASNYKNLFESAHIWTISGLENLPHALNHSEVEVLKDKFKNKPAVIVSAGPSLDKNIDLLHKYRDKVVLFGVGTAAKAIQKHNLKPDFLTIVEHNNCTEQVRGVDTSDMYMILQPMTNKNFHNMPTKTKFNYYANNDFTVKWLNKHLDVDLSHYHNKGTVSLCAMFSAIIMGCNPIILIGQDLAYSEGNCYSLNSAYANIKCVQDAATGKFEVTAEDMEEFCKHFNISPEEAKVYFLHKFKDLTENLYFVKGLNGKMIPTNPSYATFISYFETAAAEMEDKLKLINATEGGAYIQGYEHITLNEALSKYAVDSIQVNKIVDESVLTGRDLTKIVKPKVAEEITQIIEIFDKLVPVFENACSLILKLRKLIKNNRTQDKSFNNSLKDLINYFFVVEKSLIINNMLIYGLIFPEYSKMINYLKNINGNITLENSEDFLNYAYDFFTGAYQKLGVDMNTFRKVLEEMSESCNTAC